MFVFALFGAVLDGFQQQTSWHKFIVNVFHQRHAPFAQKCNLQPAPLTSGHALDEGTRSSTANRRGGEPDPQDREPTAEDAGRGSSF